MKWQLLADLPKNHKFETDRLVVGCYAVHFDNNWIRREADTNKNAGYYMRLGYTHYITFNFPPPPSTNILNTKDGLYQDDIRRG